MNRDILSAIAFLFSVFLSSAIHASDETGVEPRAAGLTITSKPAACPKSPATLADTTFTAAATGDGTVTYSWNFGDGTPAASGASIVHFYSSPGTYNVVLTVADASNPPQTSTLAVVVTDSVTSPKLLVTLNFKKPGNDSIYLTGQIRVAPGTKLDGQSFTVNVGGVLSTFTLSQFGQAKNANGSVKFFVKTQATQDVELASTFILNLKGDFQSALAASANLTNRNSNRDPVKVKAIVTFLGGTYSATINQTFIAHKDLRGITR